MWYSFGNLEQHSCPKKVLSILLTVCSIFMFLSFPYEMYQTFNFPDISKVNPKIVFHCLLSVSKCDEILSVMFYIPVYIISQMFTAPVNNTETLKFKVYLKIDCVFSCHQSRSYMTTTNWPWKKERNKIDQIWLSQSKDDIVLVEVNLCFLRVPLRWLTAAKNKTIDYKLRVNVLLKWAVIICGTILWRNIQRKGLTSMCFWHKNMILPFRTD